MENGAQPFWEKTYRSESQTFSVEPNATLKEFERLLSKQAGALDVGCGAELPLSCQAGVDGCRRF